MKQWPGQTMFLPALTLGVMLTLLPAVVNADEVYLGRIPVRGVTVVNVIDGQVVYEDRGRERRRPMENVRLGLDAIPELLYAEQAIDADDFEDAEHLYQLALAQADQPWQKSWIFYRLASEYDNRGRYVEAVGAWARLIQVREDAAWSEAAPVCAPDLPEIFVIDAAIAQLKNAEKTVRSVHLRPLIEGYLGDIEKILKQAEAGPLKEIPFVNEPDIQPTPEVDPVVPRTDEAEKEVIPARDRNGNKRRRSTKPTVGDSLDRLMDEGKWSEARQKIEILIARPKTYPVDRLLYQYGRVLRHDGQYQDAAVRFMQCAILFEDGEWSIVSLVETAKIYRDQFNENGVAKRLLERARVFAVERGDAEVLRVIDDEISMM